MTYQQALDFLFSQLPMFHRIGAPAYKANLNNTLALSELTDYPYKEFRSIHIAGTNGKGSVSHMLASVYQETGHKTGLFTSPHLIDFRERIKVNGVMIKTSYIADFITRYQNDFERIKPSFFEMTFVLAMCYFRDMKVDMAIIETGLGGRLDSTNVIIPELSVITNIGFDHMQFLGSTLEEIATEKAGIIKETVPVVIGESHSETDRVFLSKAQQCLSEIVFADKALASEIISRNIASTKLCVFSSQIVDNNHDNLPLAKPDPNRNNLRPSKVNQNLSDSPLSKVEDSHSKISLSKTEDSHSDLPLSRIDDNHGNIPLSGKVTIETPLTGDYQEKNIKTVVACLPFLKGITIENIITGIRNTIVNTGLMGRWQMLGQNPLTVCDIGHNVHGLKWVVKQIQNISYKKLHFVLGVVNDKDITGMLAILPKDATYYYCKADIPRGLSSSELKEKAVEAGLIGEDYGTVEAAYKTALSRANKEDMVFIGGSAFTVAEVLPLANQPPVIK